ncbi:MAG: hypothetical protein RLZZ628_157 [Bacteroidota bacterium]|jgi:hypothetical protein
MFDKLKSFKNQAADIQGQADELKQKSADFKEKLLNLGTGAIAVIVGSILISFVSGSWWAFVPVCALVGAVVGQTPAQSYAYGLAAMTLLWGVYAGFLSNANGGVLVGRISELLGGKVSGTQLVYVTGLLGGVLGGFATMLGAMARDLVRKDNNLQPV